ncbi:MAG: ImmA/IrrE family metallo-endopeptidase [Bdellovibrionales bacterium]
MMVSLIVFLGMAFADVGHPPVQKNCYPSRKINLLGIFQPPEMVSTDQRDLIFRKLQDAYAQEIAAEGGQLRIFETANMDFGAWAQRLNGEYQVEVWKGVRFHKMMTADAFALILCHEIGHHMGGLPKMTLHPWVSVEGQADYFAALKCFKRYLEREPTVGQPVDLMDRCSATYSHPYDIQLCARSLNAGRTLGAILADLKGWSPSDFPRLELSDENVVDQTNDYHPKPQCRLDTYRAGALCPVPWSRALDPMDPNVGTCQLERPPQGRPRCWYAPGSTALADTR